MRQWLLERFPCPFLVYIPKPIEKWSTFTKINEESFSNLKKRFVIDGYGGFQDKARECGIEKLNFSIGVKRKKPEPPVFRMAGFLQSGPKMSGQFIKIFCSERMEKNASLSVSFPGFVLV